jgi:MoaA/NifB/PqqE/SkfB family radical SAM enzyme
MEDAVADLDGSTGNLPDVALLWLVVTQRCQVECVHCYASSAPLQRHGTMTVDIWVRVIDEAAGAGIGTVKFIGGEPTLYPGLVDLIRHAVHRGLRVSVYSNLLRISPELWAALALPGVELETSYYSTVAVEHESITGRPGSFRRTNDTILEALRRGVPVRAGLVRVHPEQHVDEARAWLGSLGITITCVDRVRRIGRGAGTGTGHGDQLGELCGRCAWDRLAVCSDGIVRPCVLARWIALGDVHERGLAPILADRGTRHRTYTHIVSGRGPGTTGGNAPRERCPP